MKEGTLVVCEELGLKAVGRNNSGEWTMFQVGEGPVIKPSEFSPEIKAWFKEHIVGTVSHGYKIGNLQGTFPFSVVGEGVGSRSSSGSGVRAVAGFGVPCPTASHDEIRESFQEFLKGLKNKEDQAYAQKFLDEHFPSKEVREQKAKEAKALAAFEAAKKAMEELGLSIN